MTMTQVHRQRLDQQLTKTVSGLHHLQRHVKEDEPHSQARRHRQNQVEQLERHFEALLSRIDDPELRQRWRDHLHHRAPRPEEPETPIVPPLLFKGRGSDGSTALAREQADGQVELVVDDAVVRRALEGLELSHEPGGGAILEVDGRRYHETFEAPRSALDALVTYASGGRGEPPWEWAQALADEGLVDMTFALTPRGKRLLQARRAA